MGWILKVTGYGKIESAEIEMAPLTFLVGDNNSGKSYLMSLLWGIQNLGVDVLIGKEARLGTEAEMSLFCQINEHVGIARKLGTQTIQINEILNELQSILQERLRHNKKNIIETIFNASNVEIEELQIQLTEMDGGELELAIEARENMEVVTFKAGGGSIACNVRFVKDEQGIERLEERSFWLLVGVLYSLLMDINLTSRLNRGVYLPATRTGFMLTKDIINKVSRKAVFNITVDSEEIVPFTRPINQFLDVIADLTLEGKGYARFKEVIDLLERGMADGTVEMSSLPNKEVLYIPNGRAEGIPLRIVSAVVTELSPLVLILKHKSNLQTLFYEEPEMCLHPQLQQKMARVICQMVNAGLSMVVATHSDIILQHINNMIRLSGRKDMEDICQQFGYGSNDLLNGDAQR